MEFFKRTNLEYLPLTDLKTNSKTIKPAYFRAVTDEETNEIQQTARNTQYINAKLAYKSNGITNQWEKN